MSLQNGFIPKDKDGFVSRVMSIYQQVGAESVELIVPILYNLAMMEYFPKNELKHFFSVESLGELDIRVESKCYALIEDLGYDTGHWKNGQFDSSFFQTGEHREFKNN